MWKIRAKKQDGSKCNMKIEEELRNNDITQKKKIKYQDN